MPHEHCLRNVPVARQNTTTFECTPNPRPTLEPLLLIPVFNSLDLRAGHHIDPTLALPMIGWTCIGTANQSLSQAATFLWAQRSPDSLERWPALNMNGFVVLRLNEA